LKRTCPAVPRLAERILKLLYSQDYYLERSGDMEEAYGELGEESGPFRAKVWLWFQILKLFCGVIRTNIIWRFIMLKNYIKITLRNIKRHKTFSFINMAGLVVGMTCFLLILVYVCYELSYDSMHEKADRIYRVAFKHPGTSYMGHDSHLVTPSALAPALMESFPEVRKNLKALKQSIMENPNVLGVTTSSSVPTNIGSALGMKCKSEDGEDIEVHNYWIGVDYNFIDVFQMEMVQGRNFSKEFGTDAEGAVIVNESFVKEVNWSQSVGKKIPLFSDREVIGVVKDFHFHSLHMKIKPLTISISPDSRYLHARIRTENLPATLAYLREVYDRFKIRYPFEYFFLDDHFNQMYQAELKFGTVLITFSGLAIFIACLGIFGLAIHTAERRTKEIGIRKVLGASIPSILGLFYNELTRWILIANIIAWPVAYFFMSQWLQNFAYRINIGLWIFVVSAASAIFIALLTVSFQSIKAATANPVDSLRYE
jgi:hypothetical protein